MSTTLTEVAGNADFTTGLTVPTTGDSGTIWWGLLIDAYQELADRTQMLKLAAPGAVSTKVPIPLVTNYIATSGIFGATVSGNIPYYNQLLTSSVGRLYFPLTPCPIGLKLVSLSMIWTGSAEGSPHADITGMTMPLIGLSYVAGTLLTDVGTQSDTSANTAAYNAPHSVTYTANHTLVADRQYYVRISGETGTGAEDGKSGVSNLFATFAPV